MATTAPTPIVDVPPTGRYKIDPVGSSITFRIKHTFGLTTATGTFEVTSGDVQIAERIEASTAAVTASAASFDTRNAKRDQHVRSASFLDVETIPDLEYRSTEITRVDGIWTIAGSLSAHGVAATTVFTVTGLQRDGDGFTVVATGRIDRYAHGLTRMKGLLGRYLDVTITARARPA